MAHPLTRATPGLLGAAWLLGLDAASELVGAWQEEVSSTWGALLLTASIVSAGSLVGGLFSLPSPRLRPGDGILMGGALLVLVAWPLGALPTHHAVAAVLLTLALGLPLRRELPAWVPAAGLALAVGVLGLTLATWPWSGLGDPPEVGPWPQGEAPDSPDIVLITLDTTRADHLDHAPFLSALAAEGARFDEARAPAPLTQPAHASVLTGLQPPFHGFRQQGDALADVPTVAQHLQEAGWATAAVVGSHVLSRRFGLDRGFAWYDDQVPGLARLDHVHKPFYNRVIRETVPLLAWDLLGGDPWLLLPGARWGRSPARTAHQVTEAAVRALAQAPADRPLLLWVHYWDPHIPYAPPAGQGYAAEVSYMDQALGRLLEEVERVRPGPRWVFAVGDHGEALGEHGIEGHTGSLHEEVLRVPLVVTGPEVRARTRVTDPVTLADLGPTLLEAAGQRPPEGLHGQSLLPLLRGEPALERGFYAHRPALHGEEGGEQAWRQGRWKLILGPGGARLYDLQSDPHEARDLAEQRPEVVRGLQREVESWRATWPELDSAEPLEQEALRALGYLD